MRTGIFRKIFVIHLIALAASILFVEVYVTTVVKDKYIDSMRRGLHVQATLLSDLTPLRGDSNLDPLCQNLKKTTGNRITLILPDGRVIGDSDHPSASMDNHLDRPEIQQAGLQGAGSSIRHSNTLEEDLLYYAIAVNQGDETFGYVRLAVPLTEVNSSINDLRLKILMAVILVLVVTGGISVALTGRIHRLVRDVSAFSGALSRGELDRRLLLEGHGEFEEISRNLNHMATELKSMIEEDREKYKRLNAVLESVPDALLIIDSGDRIIMQSKTSAEFFHDAALIGKPVSKVIRNAEFMEMLEGVNKSASSSEREFTIESPVKRTVHVKISPIAYREKEASSFVALFRDVTQLKKLEQMRKDFIANVSHELKTPIASIKGFADTLLDGAMEDRDNAHRFVEIIKSNSERINSLVDDLMTLSKIEHGAIRIEKSQVRLDEVFAQVIDNFAESAARKKLELKKSLHADFREIQADRNRLFQILSNLTDNAIKYTERGSVTIGADMRDGSPFLFVSDTGIGVPEKHIGRLGERFYRVDTSRSRELGGTGLGLAIVKHLVMAHGWTMKIESVEGKGTTVKIFV